MANVPSTNSAEGSLAPESVAPSVSVIIPHYNDLANLERCMRLLAAQSLPLSQFEIVVADNNSRCGLEEVERVCGGLSRVAAGPNHGAGPARNAAVEASPWGVLAVFGSDCRPPPAW